VLEPDGRAADCASPYALVPEDVIEGGDAAFAVGHAARIALAIVAVEKFNRNAIHRFAEISYARLYRKVFGRLPDLSFGPAQIPSRYYVDLPPSDLIGQRWHLGRPCLRTNCSICYGTNVPR
jgi:DICT domain-containing protein